MKRRGGGEERMYGSVAKIFVLLVISFNNI